MPKPIYYEGQVFSAPGKPDLVYKKGKFFPVGSEGATATADPVMVDTKTDQEAINTQRERAATALNTAQQGERFMGLNQETATGPGRDGVLGWMGNWMSPKIQQMQSISAAVAPGLRPPGSGSSSDKDTKLYMQSFPGVGSYGTANEGTAKRLQTTSNQEAAKSAFYQTWYQKRGSLLGADQAFGKWWSEKGAGVYDMTRPGATGIAARQAKAGPKAPPTKIPTYNPATGEFE